MKYVNSLVESTDPKVRKLGLRVRAEQLKEKEKLYSISLTPIYKLVRKWEEIIVRLREALTSDFNADLDRLAEMMRYEDIQEVARQAELTVVNLEIYRRVNEHLDRSTYSRTVEIEQLFTLTDYVE